MRRTITALLFLISLLSAQSLFAQARIVHGIKQASSPYSSVTSDSVDTTGATGCFFAIGQYNASSATFSDAKGSTWHSLTTQSVGATQVQLAYSIGADLITGSGETFTAGNVSARFPSIVFECWSLINAYDSLQNGATTGSSTTLSTGSITPSSTTNFEITAIAMSAYDASSVNSSFTLGDHTAAIPAEAYGVAMAYRVGNAGALNPQWTLAGADEAGAIVASFTVTSAVIARRTVNNPRIGSRHAQ